MLHEFKRIPGPLQKQALIRLGLSALFLILFVAVLIAAGDIYLWAPCAGSAVFFAAAAFSTFRLAAAGGYVIVRGECAEVGVTAVKRRAKYILLRTDAGEIKVILRNRSRKMRAGTQVKLYVSKNTPIYEGNGSQMLYAYMALEVK